MLRSTLITYKAGLRSIKTADAEELHQAINDSIQHLLEAQQVICFLSQPSRRIA